MSNMSKYMVIPVSQWKHYNIKITGGISNTYRIFAPNKTMARLFAKGELRPWIKIIKIEEDIQ